MLVPVDSFLPYIPEALQTLHDKSIPRLHSIIATSHVGLYVTLYELDLHAKYYTQSRRVRRCKSLLGNEKI